MPGSAKYIVSSFAQHFTFSIQHIEPFRVSHLEAIALHCLKFIGTKDIVVMLLKIFISLIENRKTMLRKYNFSQLRSATCVSISWFSLEIIHLSIQPSSQTTNKQKKQ